MADETGRDVAWQSGAGGSRVTSAELRVGSAGE